MSKDLVLEQCESIAKELKSELALKRKLLPGNKVTAVPNIIVGEFSIEFDVTKTQSTFTLKKGTYWKIVVTKDGKVIDVIVEDYNKELGQIVSKIKEPLTC